MDNSTLNIHQSPTGQPTIRVAVIGKIISNPYQCAFYLFVVVCCITRVISGLKSEPRASNKFPEAKTVKTLPHWIPWVGHLVPFLRRSNEFFSEVDAKENTGCFAVTIGGNKINVITAPSLAKQVYDNPALPFDVVSVVEWQLDKFFDHRGSYFSADKSSIWGPMHTVIKGLTKEQFVGPAIKVVESLVGERMINLISGCDSVIDQSTWERAGKVSIVGQKQRSNDKDQAYVAEANLHILMRDFVTDIAVTAVMGRNFLENNPESTADLWAHDSKFTQFNMGLPAWLPGMRGAAAARERMIIAVQEHHKALKVYMEGGDPGPEWSDMSDVSTFMKDRLQTFVDAGSSHRFWGFSDYSMVWALSINANQLIFWMIWWVCSQPDLLNECRSEIAPFVRRRELPETGLPIKEAAKISIDVTSLWNKCPIFKGAFFETMRLEAVPVGFKLISDDFTITESREDAKTYGRTEPVTWQFCKGEVIMMPQSIHQSDKRYWDNPEQFNARRFWKTQEGERFEANQEKAVTPEDVKIDYGSMRIWGGGKWGCKGRAFAEKEILLVVAAFITMWEVEPLGNDGKWVHPGRVVTATNSPKNPGRVRMWKREGW